MPRCPELFLRGTQFSPQHHLSSFSGVFSFAPNMNVLPYTWTYHRCLSKSSEYCYGIFVFTYNVEQWWELVKSSLTMLARSLGIWNLLVISEDDRKNFISGLEVELQELPHHTLVKWATLPAHNRVTHSVCSPGCPGTHSNPPALDFWVLGLQEWTVPLSLHFWYFFLLLLTMCISCVAMCVHMSSGAYRGQSYWSCSYRQLNAWCRYWESNLGPLQEQQVFLAQCCCAIISVPWHVLFNNRNLKGINMDSTGTALRRNRNFSNTSKHTG